MLCMRDILSLSYKAIKLDVYSRFHYKQLLEASGCLGVKVLDPHDHHPDTVVDKPTIHM